MRMPPLSLLGLKVSGPGPLAAAGLLWGAAALLLQDASLSHPPLARALGGARHHLFILACMGALVNLAAIAVLIGWRLRPMRSLVAAINRVTGSLREREKMRALFGKLVPLAGADCLITPGPRFLEGRRCEVTVLLADIRDFTQLSELLSPEELMAFLNDYFERMVEIIVRNGGCVDKFMGDGILAVFGTPVAYEDHAARATACALEMHFCLKRFNAERIRSGLVPIRFGVALNTGGAVAGMVGSKDKLEFTVVGDTVNTVSRLEGLNTKFGTELLVTESTYALTRDLFAYEALGLVCVRGRQQPVGVYQLLGPDGELSRAREAAALRGSKAEGRPPLTARRGIQAKAV